MGDVRTIFVLHPSENVLDLSESNLPSGCYWMRTRDGKGEETLTKLLIIQ
jgi:hypothetical protein